MLEHPCAMHLSRSSITVQCLGTAGNGTESCWPPGRRQRKRDHLSKTEHVAAARGADLQSDGVGVWGEKIIENNSIIGWLAG